MNAVADDYENLEYIVRWSTQQLKQKEIEVSSAEVVDALAGLITEGKVQVYELSPHAPHSTPVDFSVKQADKLWFYLTPKGRQMAKNTDELGCQPPIM
jgi:hypothetical protein